MLLRSINEDKRNTLLAMDSLLSGGVLHRLSHITPCTKRGAAYLKDFQSQDTPYVKYNQHDALSFALRLPQWEKVDCPLIDQAPIFLSCVVLNKKKQQLVGITSLEKNRFSELVTFDLETKQWWSCTRTRHFRPPKRIGAAAAWTENHVFIFGGYELNNQIVGSKSGDSIVDTEQCAKKEGNSTALQSNTKEEESIPLVRLFGYPEWWLNRFNNVRYRNKRLTPVLVETLGDFHAYDLCRGEWNALISKDNKPVLEFPYHQRNVTWTHRSSAFTPNTYYSLHNKSNPRSHHHHRGKYAPTSRPSHHVVSGNSLKDPLPGARAFHTIVRCEDILVLFGGEKTDSQTSDDAPTEKDHITLVPVTHLNDVWIFNLKNMRWTRIYETRDLLGDPLKALRWNKETDFLNNTQGSDVSYFSSLEEELQPKRTSTVLPHIDESYGNPRHSVTSNPRETQSASKSVGVSLEDVLLQYHLCNNVNQSYVTTYNIDECNDHIPATSFGKHSNAGPFSAPDIPPPRSGHCAVVYRNVMYIYGGVNGTGLLGDIWALDLWTFQWRRLTTTGESPGPRVGHTAVVTGAEVWIYGGLTETDIKNKKKIIPSFRTRTNELNPKTTWSACPQSSHSALDTLIYDMSKSCTPYLQPPKDVALQHKKSGETRQPDTFQKPTSFDVHSAEFSDDNALFYLNFNVLHWKKYHCKGMAPQRARSFGRLHGCFYENHLYFGGCAGSTHEFQLSRINIQELALSNKTYSKVDTSFLEKQLVIPDDAIVNQEKLIKHKSLPESKVWMEPAISQENCCLNQHTQHWSLPSLFLSPNQSYTNELDNTLASSYITPHALNDLGESEYRDVDTLFDDMTTAATSIDGSKQMFFFDDRCAAKGHASSLLNSLLADDTPTHKASKNNGLFFHMSTSVSTFFPDEIGQF